MKGHALDIETEKSIQNWPNISAINATTATDDVRSLKILTFDINIQSLMQVTRPLFFKETRKLIV